MILTSSFSLAFLGDQALQLCVTDILLKKWPCGKVGDLNVSQLMQSFKYPCLMCLCTDSKVLSGQQKAGRPLGRPLWSTQTDQRPRAPAVDNTGKRKTKGPSLSCLHWRLVP